MLSAKDLACLASDLGDVHPDTVTLKRRSTTSDGLGGLIETWTTVDTYAARVTPISMQQAEENLGSELVDGTYFRVAVPRGTDIQIDDRIEYSGLTLSVEAVEAPRSVEIERILYVVRAAA
ncbi:phage head closure protein [bacterium]|nr:phage head closure protein [bacterium]